MDDEKQATSPASYADFGDDPPPGVLKTVLQFFAIPLLIVGIAVGLYLGINLLLGGGPKTATDFVELLQSDTINRRWQAAYELAARLGGGEVPPEFRDPALVEALASTLDQARAAREDPPRLAVLVLGLLRRLDDPAALDSIRDAVDDPDPWIRSHAILALADLSDHASRVRIAGLTSHEDPGTRQVALEALSKLDQVEGLPFRLSLETRQIALAHLGDPKEDVRFTAALILADAGNDAALPVLRKMLDRAYLDRFEFNDRWGALSAYKVRSWTLLKAIRAALAVDARGDEEVVAAMLRLADADHEGDPEVRAAALDALKRWGVDPTRN